MLTVQNHITLLPYPILHALMHLYHSWYAGEGGELVRGRLAVCGGEAVEQSRLNKQEGGEGRRKRGKGKEPT